MSYGDGMKMFSNETGRRIDGNKYGFFRMETLYGIRTKKGAISFHG